MSATVWRAILAGIFFLVILASGYWLSRSGKPYSPFPFNVHKLIALGAAVFLIWTLFQRNQVAALGTSAWIAVVVSGFLFLGTGVAGGLVSIDKPMPAVVQRIHQIAPYLTVLSTAGTLYLLPGRTWLPPT